jgi:hypothetical protein
MVNYEYGIYYAVWSGIGSLVEVAMLEKIMITSHKASPAVFMFAAVLAMATALVPIYGVIRVIALIDRGQFTFGFRNFC